MLFGTTTVSSTARLGLGGELPPIVEFIAGADVVEALEAGLLKRGWGHSVSRRSEEPASAERLAEGPRRRGWGSRRVCEELIAAGRVTVNGEVAVLGRRVDPDVDVVEVDGAPVGTKADLVHYLLNKPPAS